MSGIEWAVYVIEQSSVTATPDMGGLPLDGSLLFSLGSGLLLNMPNLRRCPVRHQTCALRVDSESSEVRATMPYRVHFRDDPLAHWGRVEPLHALSAAVSVV